MFTGALSLLRNTASGVSSSLGAVGGKIGELTAEAAFDSNYKRARDQRAQLKDKHVGQGLRTASSIFVSVCVCM